MTRQEQVRRRGGRADPEPPLRVPRRPLADTRTVAVLLERIRRLLGEPRG